MSRVTFEQISIDDLTNCDAYFSSPLVGLADRKPFRIAPNITSNDL